MPKIWSYCDPSLSGFGLFKRCILSELKHHSWDTYLSVEPLLRQQSKQKIFQHFYNTNPDWILLINQSAVQFYDYIGLPQNQRPLQVKKIVWYLDDPQFFVDRDFEQDEFVLSFDETYLDFIKSKKPGASAFFPLAADMVHEGNFNSKFACDVCFVGGVIDQSQKRFQLSDEMRRYVDQLVELKLENFSISFQDLAKQYPIQPGKNIQINGSVANYLYWEANNHYRIKIIQSLQDYNLKIYGNEDWSKLLEGKAAQKNFMGPCDQATELPDIFSTVPININIHSIQCRGSMNQRDFNAPIAGGFLLSDWVPCAGKYFIPGQEAIYWSTIEDLRNKINYYLEHPDERQKIIHHGKRKILKKHTYTARVEHLLKLMKSAGWY